MGPWFLGCSVLSWALSCDSCSRVLEVSRVPQWIGTSQVPRREQLECGQANLQLPVISEGSSWFGVMDCIIKVCLVRWLNLQEDIQPIFTVSYILIWYLASTSSEYSGVSSLSSCADTQDLLKAVGGGSDFNWTWTGWVPGPLLSTQTCNEQQAGLYNLLGLTELSNAYKWCLQGWHLVRLGSKEEQMILRWENESFLEEVALYLYLLYFYWVRVGLVAACGIFNCSM